MDKPVIEEMESIHHAPGFNLPTRELLAYQAFAPDFMRKSEAAERP